VRETIEREILRAREYPEIVFRGRVIGDAAPFVVEGTLSLRGHTQPLRVPLDTRGPRWSGEVEFAPSRWGIKPYRALGGAL
jgi:polyisoprenoid-binding protein YceI